MKKGQATTALLYIAGGIIAAAAIYYGVSSVMQVRETGEETSLELLKETIRNDVERISQQYGANRTHSYYLGADFTRICFTDTTKNDIIEDDADAPDIINDSAESDSPNNVFLLGPSTEAFEGGDIRVCLEPHYKCFNATRGTANVRMYGGGGFAEFDPCEPFRVEKPIPRCYNASGVPLYKRYDFLPSDALSFEMGAEDHPSVIARLENVEDARLTFAWIVTDKNADEIDSDERLAAKTSPAQDTYEFAPADYGRYKIMGIAESVSTGLQCSVEFVREFALPGTTYPEARIAPEDFTPGIFSDLSERPLVIPSDKAATNIEFVGYGNDSHPGELTASWDWGDGNTADCDPSGGRTFNQSYECSESHAYDEIGVTRLIKFTVTNPDTGRSAADSLRITVGNTFPWIVLERPVHNAVLSTTETAMDVNFNFTPYDNEQDGNGELDCQLSVDGSTASLGQQTSGALVEKTVRLGTGDHFWSASCSDGINTNSSETRTFTIIENAAPVIALQKPDDGASVPEDVELNYTASDEDYEEIKCNLSLYSSGSFVESDKRTIQPLGYVIIQGFSPASLNPGQTYYWNVTCEDRFVNVTSETRDFTVQGLPALACVVKQNCGTLTPMLSLSGTTNAHVDSDPSSSSYSYNLCCNLTREGDLTNYLTDAGCGVLTSSSPFIRLSSNINAHASYFDTGYLVEKCFNKGSALTGVNIECEFATTCPAGKGCILTLSGTTNAHVASCDSSNAYSNKICCNATQTT